MSELPLIAVTDSASCPRPLAEQIERLTKLTELRPQAVILRAKSLDKAAYRTLALQAQQSCKVTGIPLILHSDWQLAHDLGISKLHLPPNDGVRACVFHLALHLRSQRRRGKRSTSAWCYRAHRRTHLHYSVQGRPCTARTWLSAGCLQRCKLAGLRHRRHRLRRCAAR